MQAVDDLEPLAAVMPADADERCKYVFIYLAAIWLNKITYKCTYRYIITKM